MPANTNPSELQAVKERLEACIKRDPVTYGPNVVTRLVRLEDLRALLLSHSEMEGEIKRLRSPGVWRELMATDGSALNGNQDL